MPLTEFWTFKRSEIVEIFRDWIAECKEGDWPQEAATGEKSADTFIEYAEAKWPEKFGK